ncbi:MAG: hypothetical protein JNL70_20710 [Saprospiraceae bacterium]|nr:hypothetical protein [Saprospiraceae bacterium]
MIKTLKTVLLSLFFFSVHAQNGFVDAIVYKSDGSTMTGQIKYQEWFINPEFVQFRASNSSNIQKLYPKDISKFTITGKNETYQSAILEIANRTTKDLEASDAYETERDALQSINWRQDTVFLRLLEKGNLSLFSYVTLQSPSEHFFIQKGKEKYIELLNLKFRLKDPQGKHTIVYSFIKDYITRLTYATDDCKYFISKLTNLELNESDLKRIVKTYNNCVGKSEYSSASAKAKVNFFVQTGVALPFATINSFGKYDNIKGNLTVPIGLGLEIRAGRALSPLRIGTTLSFVSSKFDQYLSANSREIQYDAKLTGLYLMPYMRANFASKIRVGHAYFFKLGLNLAYFPKADYTKSYTQPANFFSPEVYDLKSSSITASLIAGYQIKKWFAEVKMEQFPLSLIPANINDNIFKPWHHSFLVGYYF